MGTLIYFGVMDQIDENRKALELPPIDQAERDQTGFRGLIGKLRYSFRRAFVSVEDIRDEREKERILWILKSLCVAGTPWDLGTEGRF